MDFWSLIGFFFWTWLVIAYLVVLFWVFSDLFRDHTLNGWMKALWILFIVFMPYLAVFVYIIARGASMNERMSRSRYRNGVVPEDYSSPAPSANPASDITQAKQLLDQGIINQGEFEALKAKALGAR